MTALKGITQTLNIDLIDFGPVSRSETHSVDFIQPGGTSIISLLDSGSPSAIPRRIGTVIIQAIYTMIGRGPRAHILNKNVEACPFGTNRNSATAVSFKVFVLRVLASLSHTLPDMIFGGPETAMRAMGECRCQATARMLTAPNVRADFYGITAITLAHPIITDVMAFRLSQSRRFGYDD